MRLTSQEQFIIEQFARGDVLLRREAITIHRKYPPINGEYTNLHQKFMAEEDSLTPNVRLRMNLRRKLLANVGEMA